MKRVHVQSFLDELEKISSALTPEQKERRKSLALTGLGLISGPVIGVVGNSIMFGRPTPEGVSMKRWVPATMATGAMVSGALPVLRRRIEQHYNQDVGEV